MPGARQHQLSQGAGLLIDFIFGNRHSFALFRPRVSSQGTRCNSNEQCLALQALLWRTRCHLTQRFDTKSNWLHVSMG